jgi:predicted porin
MDVARDTRNEKIRRHNERKLLVPGAMLFACAGAYAQSAVWLSGYVDLNIEHLIQSGPASVTRMTSGGLNNSRFNLSGVEDLGGGYKAVFTIEPMFSADTGVQSAQFRQSFVGLKSADLGEVTMGRQFTPSYWIAGYADPSWAAAYSMVNNMEFFYASYRVDNAIQYKTPTFYGFTGRVMYAFGLEDTTRAGRFLSIGVDYRNGPLFLGAVSEQQYTRDIHQASQIPSSRDNYFSAVYRIGGFEPTAIFHTYKGYYAYPPMWRSIRAAGMPRSARAGTSTAAAACMAAWSIVTTTTTRASPARPVS